MHKLIPWGFTLLCWMLSPSALATHATHASVAKLVALTNTSEVVMTSMREMLPFIKNAVPDAPEAFWQDLMNELNPQELQKLLIPIYQKNFSEEEIQGLITFYQSPLGQKYIGLQMNMMDDSAQAAQMWMQNTIMRLVQKYQAESQADAPQFAKPQ